MINRSFLSPGLRDGDCLPEHPLPAAARVAVRVEEADADLGAGLFGRHGRGPELDVEAQRGQQQQQAGGEEEAGTHCGDQAVCHGPVHLWNITCCNLT